METKKHSTPILAAVLQQHREDDKANGVDPYNTGRHRALLLKDAVFTQEQKAEADGILSCYETELRL